MKLATLVTSLSIACLALAAHTDQSEAKGPAKGRPFKATGTAVWDNILAAFPPSLGAHFIGEGHGTHLGEFEQIGDLVFDGQPDAEGDIPGHGSVILFAANGDELHFDYVGELSSVTGIGSGTLEFTGGTGRFEDASGTGEFYAELDLSGGFVAVPMLVELTGRLNY